MEEPDPVPGTFSCAPAKEKRRKSPDILRGLYHIKVEKPIPLRYFHPIKLIFYISTYATHSCMSSVELAETPSEGVMRLS